MTQDWIYVDESMTLARRALTDAFLLDRDAAHPLCLLACIDELTQLCGGLVRVARSQADAIAKLEAAAAPVIASSDDVPEFLRRRLA